VHLVGKLDHDELVAGYPGDLRVDVGVASPAASGREIDGVDRPAAECGVVGTVEGGDGSPARCGRPVTSHRKVVDVAVVLDGEVRQEDGLVSVGLGAHLGVGAGEDVGDRVVPGGVADPDVIPRAVVMAAEGDDRSPDPRGGVDVADDPTQRSGAGTGPGRQ